MNIEIKEQFLRNWEKYFNKSDLPVVFYYTDTPKKAEIVPPGGKWSCLICELQKVRAVIGMFDVSARTCVPRDVLSFSVPMVKFEKMISYMDECFLITESWKKVRKRLI